MNTTEFYYGVLLLLSRMGYSTAVEQFNIQAGDEQEKKSREWLGHALEGVEILTGVEVPWYKNIYIPLDNLSDEDRTIFIQDWQYLKRNTPIAGLRYARGLPLVFAVKHVDFENPENLAELYAQMHKEFLEFADNHILAIDRNANSIMTLCLAFQDSATFENARKAMGRGKCNFVYFKRAYTEVWLYNLNTHEVIHPKSLGSAGIRMAEALGSIGNPFSEKSKLGSIEEWKPPSKLLTMGMMGPKTFLGFIDLYYSDLKRGAIHIPQDFIDNLKKEEVGQTIKTLESKLKLVQQNMQENLRQLGAIIFKEFHNGRAFPQVASLLKDASSFANEIHKHGQKVKLLKQNHQEWIVSTEKKNKFQIELGELKRSYENYCAQLGQSFFEHERKWIKENATLEKAYAICLQLQGEINTRNHEIAEMENKEEGLFSRMLTNTRILYLKGINEKDKWSMKKHWGSAGAIVFDNVTELPTHSLVFPIWSQLKNITEQRAGLENDTQQESLNQKSILEQVNKLIGDKESQNIDWIAVQNSFEREIEVSIDKLSRVHIDIGHLFRRTNLRLGNEEHEIEKMLSLLEKEEQDLSRTIEMSKTIE